MESSSKNSKRLVIDIDEETHKEIKIRATERGLSIRQYVMQAILQKIAEEKKYE